MKEENDNEEGKEEEYDSNKNFSDEDDTKIDPNLYQTRDFINFYKKYSKKLPDNFLKERQIGQNENEICKLIREDLIDEFITYVNKNDYPLNSCIKKSIYETNNFLIEQNETKLIEYASFFGSTQIFKYLYKNGVELTSSLWIYGIHSDNAEIIQLLEENKVEPPNKEYEECIKESIKCHHNDITNYILSNFINEDIENIYQIDFEEKYNENIYSYCFHYYNFSYFPNEIEHQIIFYYACEFDYIEIVEYFLKTKKINIEETIIIIINSSNFKINLFFIIIHQ